MQPSASKSTASVGDGSAWTSRRPNRDLLLISCMPLSRGMIETHDVGGSVARFTRDCVSPHPDARHELPVPVRASGQPHNMSERGVAAFWVVSGCSACHFLLPAQAMSLWGFEYRRMMSGTVAEGNGSVMRLENWAQWRRFDGPLISRWRLA